MKKKTISIFLGLFLLIAIVLCLLLLPSRTSSKKDLSDKKGTSDVSSKKSDKKNSSQVKEEKTEEERSEEKNEEKTEDTKKEEDKKEEAPSQTEQKPSSPVSALEMENNQKRKGLESSYGLSIFYGDEAMYASYELIHTNDHEVIRNQLTILEEELIKYPYGFFFSFAHEGMPLSIFLVEGVSGRDIAGAADTSNGAQPKLILTNRNFRETFHHEMMHCIDSYLRIMMYRGGTDPYSEYASHNPSDFVYGNTSYQEPEPGNPHFWFDYAKSSVEEDRAELFKAMMTVRSVLLKRGSLQQKGIVISRQLKTYFSISGRPYWEQSIDVSL